ncbi:hypothetical protein [Methylobacterium sp. Leaf118]|uniref:hypothetical protein n=1 Tax=Methylobacterium sp. Leaf118 TaxID=2876562 RepID=UPI001E30227B|nr:hypothetical protein [Methylobacterium sp. Leaf118]
MRRPLRLPLLLAGILLAGPVLAQGAPRSMAECERLKNDLAYNQCLAMFGPPARNVGGGDGGASAAAATSVASTPVAATATIPGIPSVEEPDLQESGRRGRRGRYARRGGGRMSAAFTVGAAEDSVSETASDTPRRRHRRRR